MVVVIITWISIITMVLIAINKMLKQVDCTLDNCIKIKDKWTKITKHPNGNSDASDK